MDLLTDIGIREDTGSKLDWRWRKKIFFSAFLQISSECTNRFWYNWYFWNACSFSFKMNARLYLYHNYEGRYSIFPTSISRTRPYGDSLFSTPIRPYPSWLQSVFVAHRVNIAHWMWYVWTRNWKPYTCIQLSDLYLHVGQNSKCFLREVTDFGESEEGKKEKEEKTAIGNCVDCMMKSCYILCHNYDTNTNEHSFQSWMNKLSENTSYFEIGSWILV